MRVRGKDKCGQFFISDEIFDSILQKKRCPPSFSYLDVLFIYGSLYAVFSPPGELERWAEPTAAAVAEQQLLRSSPFSSSVNYHNGGYSLILKKDAA